MVQEKDRLYSQRHNMVETQLKPRGINDERVLEAMLEVPRHLFVPENMKEFAYQDGALPISEGQTISQPYIVAYMIEKLEIDSSSIVLEIGTGSGYGAAVLSRIAARVFTVERHGSLAEEAERKILSLGYDNISVKVDDGSEGWWENAPYDGIVVTAAANFTPDELVGQLKTEANMVIPIGDNFSQKLVKVKVNQYGDLIEKDLISVRFVPLISGS